MILRKVFIILFSQILKNYHCIFLRFDLHRFQYILKMVLFSHVFPYNNINTICNIKLFYRVRRRRKWWSTWTGLACPPSAPRPSSRTRNRRNQNAFLSSGTARFMIPYRKRTCGNVVWNGRHLELNLNIKVVCILSGHVREDTQCGQTI